MANYTAMARSNLFRVKNDAAFRQWTGHFQNLAVEYHRESGRFGLRMDDPSGAGWPLCRESNGTMVEADFTAELSKHLEDGEVAILMEVGNEGMRYLLGTAVAVNSRGTVSTVSLDEIYRRAAKLTKRPEGVSLVSNALKFIGRGQHG